MTRRRVPQDVLDLSDQRLAEFPTVSDANLISGLNVSQNLIRSLPVMTQFMAIEILDVSHNQLVDLSSISVLMTLRELNCSHNRIVSLGFVGALPALRVLHASHNRITTVTAQIPETLTECDLSYNSIDSVEFLQYQFPETVERLDFSGNGISDVIELRYVAVFTGLLLLSTGLLELHPDLQLVQFARHLCPTLAVFDGVDCDSEEPSPDFPDSEQLFQVLLNGDEETLCSLLHKEDTRFTWAPATFLPFEEDVPSFDSQDLGPIRQHLAELERRVPGAHDSEDDAEEDAPEYPPERFELLRQEVEDMKAEVRDLLKMVYVHDSAVKDLFLQA
jgi:hypothetical protein